MRSEPIDALSAWRDQHAEIRSALKTEVLGHVLGQGKDHNELWDGFSETLPVFKSLLDALTASMQRVPSTAMIQHDLQFKGLSKAVSDLDPSVDVGRIIQVGFRNTRRAMHVAERLRTRGKFAEFLRTDRGQWSITASFALPWSIFGMQFILDDLDQATPDDLFFCLELARTGPLDQFAFVRAFELDLVVDEDGEDIEPGELTGDLAVMENEESEFSEKLLELVESDG
jgi:hypothetical protein